ncbi:DUF429 domain-containing protein [Micromonospora chalcea]
MSRRQADVLAYKLVGPRRSSVFMTPVRAALEAGSHAVTVQVNRERAGEGVSAQVYGLRAKIFEVDIWARQAGRQVVEVHPEVSFARLAGLPLPDGKRTWAGAHHRRRLLTDAGIHLADDVGEAGHAAAVDDVLDAGVAAWTADESPPVPQRLFQTRLSNTRMAGRQQSGSDLTFKRHA